MTSKREWKRQAKALSAMRNEMVARISVQDAPGILTMQVVRRGEVSHFPVTGYGPNGVLVTCVVEVSVS